MLFSVVFLGCFFFFQCYVCSIKSTIYFVVFAQQGHFFHWLFMRLLHEYESHLSLLVVYFARHLSCIYELNIYWFFSQRRMPHCSLRTITTSYAQKTVSKANLHYFCMHFHVRSDKNWICLLREILVGLDIFFQEICIMDCERRDCICLFCFFFFFCFVIHKQKWRNFFFSSPLFACNLIKLMGIHSGIIWNLFNYNWKWLAYSQFLIN